MFYNWQTINETDEWIYQEHKTTSQRRAKCKVRHHTVYPDTKWLTRGGAAKPTLHGLFETIYYGTCRPMGHESIEQE